MNFPRFLCFSPLAIASALVLCGQPALRARAGDVWLSKLDLSSVEQEWGSAHADKSTDAHPLSIGGKAFARGVGTHAAGVIIVALDGKGERFEAQVGVDDETRGRGRVVFRVEADGQEVFHSGVMRGGEAAKPVSVDLAGVKSLVLLSEKVEDDNRAAHADWADARFVMQGDARPKLGIFPGDEPVILTPKPAAAPRLNGARVFGVRPGAPFLFTVAATGERPLTFAADGLPEGLKLDAQTGRITGSLSARGEHAVTLHARNARGEATRPFKIVCGPTIGLTPALGWNSWNCFASAVTAEHVRAAADAMVSSGLADHGWTYVNIDDFWQVNEGSSDPTLRGPKRDAQGNILANPRFPDMKGLADYVHDLGLKIGIYSTPGPRTCGGCEGSWQHEAQDARRYGEWGFDYLKYDWCSYGDQIHYNGTISQAREPYQVMGVALEAVPRDILYSLGQYGWGDVWKWGKAVGGNLWRTNNDITDTWASMSADGFEQASMAAYSEPGHFNDPDMLVVGKVGWGPQLHPTRLTPNEQYTHLSLWCLLAAPLLIGCDMTQLDPFTLGLLTNDEVLDVDQDPLGKQAVPVNKTGALEVWSKPLEDGSRAVGLFNRGYRAAKVTARWTDLGVTGQQTVRDLWRQQDVGTFGDGYEAIVPPHGVVLVRVMAAR